jgi:hypothetical protein
VNSLQSGTALSAPALLSFSINSTVSSFIRDKVIRNSATIKEKELRHAGWPKSATLKKKPRRSGV